MMARESRNDSRRMNEEEVNSTVLATPIHIVILLDFSSGLDYLSARTQRHI